MHVSNGGLEGTEKTVVKLTIQCVFMRVCSLQFSGQEYKHKVYGKIM
jgi:hypothetical protein